MKEIGYLLNSNVVNNPDLLILLITICCKGYLINFHKEPLPFRFQIWCIYHWPAFFWEWSNNILQHASAFLSLHNLALNAPYAEKPIATTAHHNSGRRPLHLYLQPLLNNGNISFTYQQTHPLFAVHNPRSLQTIHLYNSFLGRCVKFAERFVRFHHYWIATPSSSLMATDL